MSQPDFVEPELMLLLDYFVAQKRGEKRSIDALSATLRSLGVHQDHGDADRFRNVDGIARAVRRFRVYDSGAGDRDTPTYRDVWERYARDPAALKAAVEEVLRRLADGPPRLGSVGRPYEPADEAVSFVGPDPFPVDPSLIERGLKSHARLQNNLAEDLRSRGLSPLTPRAEDPMFDLAWRDGDELRIAEIKSLTRDNEERQLRLGLGQLLHYRELLSCDGQQTRALLFVEHEPRDNIWIRVCGSVGVDLRWPPWPGAERSVESGADRRPA